MDTISESFKRSLPSLGSDLRSTGDLRLSSLRETGRGGSELAISGPAALPSLGNFTLVGYVPTSETAHLWRCSNGVVQVRVSEEVYDLVRDTGDDGSPTQWSLGNRNPFASEAPLDGGLMVASSDSVGRIRATVTPNFVRAPIDSLPISADLRISPDLVSPDSAARPSGSSLQIEIEGSTFTYSHPVRITALSLSSTPNQVLFGDQQGALLSALLRENTKSGTTVLDTSVIRRTGIGEDRPIVGIALFDKYIGVITAAGVFWEECYRKSPDGPAERERIRTKMPQRSRIIKISNLQFGDQAQPSANLVSDFDYVSSREIAIAFVGGGIGIYRRAR